MKNQNPERYQQFLNKKKWKSVNKNPDNLTKNPKIL